MPNTRLIKSRIRSAQNIAKITKAMEMVSASKMRRAQEQVRASRPYAQKLHEVLSTIAEHTESSLHPLLQTPELGKPLLVLVSTDRGLCGGLNTNLFKAALEFADKHSSFALVTVGKRAKEYASRMGWTVDAAFTDMPERISFNDALPIAELIRDGFLRGTYNRVTVLHAEFVTTLTQRPAVTELLPLQAATLAGAAGQALTHPTSGGPNPGQALQATSDTGPGPQDGSEYVFEPAAKDILNWLLPYFVEMEVYQLLLDAKASEHSARMVSMQNASNNAKDVVAALKLQYNKSRQAGITSELLDITTASLSIQA